MQKVTLRLDLEIVEEFPDEWTTDEMEKYIEKHFDEYDHEIVNVDVWEVEDIEEDGQDYDEWRDLNE